MQDSYENIGKESIDYVDRQMDAPSNSGGADQTHKMRLSIDVRSIKDTTFKGLIYAKYSANPTLGNFLEMHDLL